MKFDELHLLPALTRAVAEAGYEEPSPIQQKAIPPALENRDLFGCAQTGTGKTAAFALPILQRLMGDRAEKGRRPVRALILTPTRELALQVGASFKTYGRHTRLRATVVHGGVRQTKQVHDLKEGVDILVATPGRLIDLMGQGHVHLDQIEIFVLDEADRMLDMGFIADIRRIVARVPKQRQTMLFSATIPREIRDLAASLLSDPIEVSVARSGTTVELTEQRVYYVERSAKLALMLHLLRDETLGRVLVFTRTKYGADRLMAGLKLGGIDAHALHGDKSQKIREQTLARFKQGGSRVLVATDIASRGIDIDDITHVVNFDVPNEPEAYVHRIGRTGRAGATGIALTFCGFQERPFLAAIEALIGKRMAVVDDHPFPSILPPPKPIDLTNPEAVKNETRTRPRPRQFRPGRRR